MAVVGYFQGTDPMILTKLALKGIDVLPISNIFDSHGKPVGHLTDRDQIGVVIGYCHKVLPSVGAELTTSDLLFNCKLHKIPMILIVNDEDQPKARELLGEAGSFVQFSNPGDLYEKTLSCLER